MRRAGLVLLTALAAAGCATIESRIKSHQAAFDASPTAVQQKIRRGEADVGFSADQVEMALGHPDRVYVSKTPAGVQTIWVYGLDFGPGTGAALFVHHDGNIVVTDAFFEEHERVIFENGKAVAVERRQR